MKTRKLISALSAVIVLIILLLPSPGLVSPVFADTGTLVTTTTSTSGWSVVYSFQRKIVYANERLWLFYTAAADGKFYFRSSTDLGANWSAATQITTQGYNESVGISVYLEGSVTLHYVISSSDTGELLYRKGTLEANGTITWIATEQVVETVATYYYFYPYIIVDSEGYPWIGYGKSASGIVYGAYVIKSSTNNGTWTTEGGFPQTLVSGQAFLTAAIGAALTSGKTYWVYRETATGVIRGRLWNGVSWDAAENASATAGGGITAASVVGDGDNVHIVFTELTGDFSFIYRRRLYGTGWGAEQVVQTSVPGIFSTISLVSANSVIVGWANPTTNHVYYRESSDGTFADVVDWIDESMDGINDYAVCSAMSVSSGTVKLAFAYVTKDASPYNLKFAKLLFATSAPTVTSVSSSSVGETTATVTGNITATEGEDASLRGAEWDTNSGAPYSNNVTEGGSFGTGTFNTNFTGLPAGTTIYWRALAQNSAGTGYGSELTFLTKPSAPTNIVATDGAHNDKVTVTWTQSTGATGYKVYEGANLLDTLGDVSTYDDTAAPAGSLTPGTATASDGDYPKWVRLLVTGDSTSDGAVRTYTVVAFSASGDSPVSNNDTGYRGVGDITYLWYRSLGDSDAAYVPIFTATTNPYDDPYGVIDPDGRYYKAELSATGAVSQNTTADRGYMPTLEKFLIGGGNVAGGLVRFIVAALALVMVFIVGRGGMIPAFIGLIIGVLIFVGVDMVLKLGGM